MDERIQKYEEKMKKTLTNLERHTSRPDQESGRPQIILKAYACFGKCTLLELIRGNVVC